MTTTTMSPASLSDAALLAETVQAAVVERRATAELIALLAEVDARRLYLGQGYPSLFAWCTGVLHLSEPAAYSRITAARAARRYLFILTRLADGDVTLTTITLLATHLTDENHEALLEAARHRSKRDVERLVASLVLQPDIASSVRKVHASAVSSPPSVLSESAPVRSSDKHTDTSDSSSRLELHSATVATPDEHRTERTQCPAHPRAVVAPLTSDRYLLKVTLSAEARARLDRARDLLRHVVPTGDPALIIDRALTVLVEQLERSRCAAARRPQTRPRSTSTRRQVPASVKRAVWARDNGRCAFVGTNGRCRETGWLELHHVVPFARGGPTTVENLELRCRAHNAYEAEREFGPRPRARGDRARGADALARDAALCPDRVGLVRRRCLCSDNRIVCATFPGTVGRTRAPPRRSDNFACRGTGIGAPSCGRVPAATDSSAPSSSCHQGLHSTPRGCTPADSRRCRDTIAAAWAGRRRRFR